MLAPTLAPQGAGWPGSGRPSITRMAQRAAVGRSEQLFAGEFGAMEPSLVLEPGARILERGKAPYRAAVAAGAERHMVDSAKVAIDDVDRRRDRGVIFRPRHQSARRNRARSRMSASLRCRVSGAQDNSTSVPAGNEVSLDGDFDDKLRRFRASDAGAGVLSLR